MKNKIIILLSIVVLILVGFIGLNLPKSLFDKRDLQIQFVEDESAVIRVVERSNESVVTISSDNKDGSRLGNL